MKKLLVMPLILSVSLLITACGENVEQVKNEAINKAASAQLDKMIEEKSATLTDGAESIVDGAIDVVEEVIDAPIDVVEEIIEEPTEAPIETDAPVEMEEPTE